MALKLQKPILSLTNNDYNEFGLGDLIVEEGDAYEINLQVYYMLRDSITGWPGGKPDAHLPTHPERSEPYPKRVIIFNREELRDKAVIRDLFFPFQNPQH